MVKFIEGVLGKARVLRNIGITPGFTTIFGSKKAEKDIVEIRKKARHKRRAHKRKQEEE